MPVSSRPWQARSSWVPPRPPAWPHTPTCSHDTRARSWSRDGNAWNRCTCGVDLATVQNHGGVRRQARNSPTSTCGTKQQLATRSASTHRRPDPIGQANQPIRPASRPRFARQSSPWPCHAAQPSRLLTTVSAPWHPQTPRRAPPRPAAAQQKPAHPVASATGCTLRPTAARAPARSPPLHAPAPASGCGAPSGCPVPHRCR